MGFWVSRLPTAPPSTGPMAGSGRYGSRSGMMDPMPKPIPASTRTSLHQRLLARQRERWPELADVQVCFCGRFAYVDGGRAGGEVLPLCRLRYVDSASVWGFAIYLASRDGYQDSVLPSGRPVGTPQGPGLRLRPLPQRPQRLTGKQTASRSMAPHELAGRTTR
jgi:hypothetical protein